MSGAEQYIADVLEGRQVACKWVRLACERHVRDLATGAQRGLWFDASAAAHAIGFFAFLKHSKGEWAGKRIQLEPWQQFILWVVFGWMRRDPESGEPVRRFRMAFLEVARKNGKSTIAAGVGLYLFDADGEPGAEVYTAATKRDQARITHAEATRMVKASKYLSRRIRCYKDNLHIPGTASKFEPLGRDTDSMDGLNVHGAIVDELHAHKNRETWDLLDTATGSRRQALIWGITTSGADRHSLCFDLHDYTEKVLQEVVQDDAFFGLIYTLDEGDDWSNERNWVKANPNMGVSKKWDDMRRKAVMAKEMPTTLSSFLRRELNVWVQGSQKWMNLEKWKLCGQTTFDPASLTGRTCYGGLDLSSSLDVTAFALVFPPLEPGEPYKVLLRAWIPEENMRLRSRRDKVPYDAWVRAELLTTTPGDVIDYDFIIAQIVADAKQFNVAEIGFDRWGAAAVVQALQKHDLAVVEMGQGFATMSAPMKELERLVYAGKLAHNNNAVLTWMADNVVATKDSAGNIKPDKEKAVEKIDGIVALIMALDRATRGGDAAGSVYEEQEIRTL